MILHFHNVSKSIRKTTTGSHLLPMNPFTGGIFQTGGFGQSFVDWHQIQNKHIATKRS